MKKKWKKEEEKKMKKGRKRQMKRRPPRPPNPPPLNNPHPLIASGTSSVEFPQFSSHERIWDQQIY